MVYWLLRRSIHWLTWLLQFWHIGVIIVLHLLLRQGNALRVGSDGFNVLGLPIPLSLLLVESLWLLIEVVLISVLLILGHPVLGILIHESCLLGIMAHIEHALHLIELFPYYKLLKEGYEQVNYRVAAIRIGLTSKAWVQIQCLSIIALGWELLIVCPMTELYLDDQAG